MRSVDWEEVHRHDFFYDGKCWNSGCMSYCCSSYNPEFNFRLIKDNESWLFYIPSEYKYLKERRRLSDGVEGKSDVRVISLDFGEKYPINLIMRRCRLRGKCTDIIEKPLICRLYPFLPVLDSEGRLNDILPPNLFDLTCEAFEWKSRCTSWVHERGFFLEMWGRENDLLAPLQHPLIIFYLQSARAFAENFKTSLRGNAKLAGKSGPEFWMAWEAEYLGNRLLDVPRLEKGIATIFNELSIIFGARELESLLRQEQVELE